MQLKHVIDAIDYRITSAEKYYWACYGEDVLYINFDDIRSRPVGSFLFNSRTAEVYEITVEVPGEELCYRWIRPGFENDYRLEAAAKGVPADIAWDDVEYTDIETEDDILEKLTAIINCQEFDRTIEIPIKLTEAEELCLHRQAHAAGMTTNEYANMALRAAIDSENKKLDERYIR